MSRGLGDEESPFAQNSLFSADGREDTPSRTRITYASSLVNDHVQDCIHDRGRFVRITSHGRYPGYLCMSEEIFTPSTTPHATEVDPYSSGSIIEEASTNATMMGIRDANSTENSYTLPTLLCLLQQLFYGSNENAHSDEGSNNDDEDVDAYEDMRLDIDNMSYEELLALTEHVGHVNTGLSREVIREKLKRYQFQPFDIGSSKDKQTCSICLEDYVDCQGIGELDCGHTFHYKCVKEWLVQKNLCPICKRIALAN